MMNNYALPPVQQIAKAFSQAAPTYDQVAGLQRLVADQLLCHDKGAHQGSVLDIGCGTGYVCGQLAQLDQVTSVTGLDVAEGMLSYAQKQHPNPKLNWVLGDAQDISNLIGLSKGGYDLVISSLAIQWCANLSGLFSGVAESLSPKGVFHCATLGPDTLGQLKWAWGQVDDYQHVNEFVPLDVLRAHLQQHFSKVTIVSKDVELGYDTVQQLTRDLKQLGASNHNQKAAPGLTSMGRLRKMIKAYEQLRDSSGKLPVTYQVFYIEASL